MAGDVDTQELPFVSPLPPTLGCGPIGDVIRGDAFEIGRNILITPDEISRRILEAISEDGARVLLDMLTRPAAERASLIGAVAQHADGEWLAGLLTDFEVDEVARLHLVETLRAAISRVNSDAGQEPLVARREGVEPPTF